jgi:hypothetical protein
MQKKMTTEIAIARHTDLAGRAIARMDTAAQAVLNGAETERRLQLVSAPGSLSALIRADGVTIQIENGTFAVTTD